MNFNLIVTICVFAITGNNVVRADWDSSYPAIYQHFDTFMQSFKNACLSQNSNLFTEYDPASGWRNTTTSVNFKTNTEGNVTILTQFFKHYRTSGGISAVKDAVRLLCSEINSNGNIDDQFKHMGIPNREHLKKRVYEDGLEETSMHFDQDCPRGPPNAQVLPKAPDSPEAYDPYEMKV